MKLPVFWSNFSPMFPKWTLKNIWHMIIFCILCKCFKVGFVFAHHFLSVRLSVCPTYGMCVLNSSNFKTIMPKSFTSLDALLLLLLLLLLVFVRLTVYMFDRLSVHRSIGQSECFIFVLHMQQQQCFCNIVLCYNQNGCNKLLPRFFLPPSIYYEA